MPLETGTHTRRTRSSTHLQGFKQGEDVLDWALNDMIPVAFDGISVKGNLQANDIDRRDCRSHFTRLSGYQLFPKLDKDTRRKKGFSVDVAPQDSTEGRPLQAS